ncbi:hypothetical protein ACFLYY_01620 [Patescibacteria group bacterium]
MSNWDIQLKDREEIIEIKTILRKWEEHAADFPAIEFKDTKGREHTLSYVDITCSREEFSQLKEGSKIVISIGEKIVGLEILTNTG